MGLFSINKNSLSNIEWFNLSEESQIEDLMIRSSSNPIMFFKHSTRCSISGMVKNRLENKWDINEGLTPVLLDLIKYRSISNLLSDKFNVKHESPQVILIKDGQCVYHASHNQINVESIKTQL